MMLRLFKPKDDSCEKMDEKFEAEKTQTQMLTEKLRESQKRLRELLDELERRSHQHNH